MGLFGAIVRTVVNTAALPIAAAADVVTLGNKITMRWDFRVYPGVRVAGSIIDRQVIETQRSDRSSARLAIDDLSGYAATRAWQFFNSSVNSLDREQFVNAAQRPHEVPAW